MQLVEKHIIKKGDSRYKILDEHAFLSKNLYNASLYAIQEHYKQTQSFLNYNALCKKFQDDNNPDYRALNSKIGQWVLKQACTAYESYFNALRDYQKHPHKYKACPRPPFYKPKIRGRNVLICTIQTIGRKKFAEKTLALLSGLVELRTQILPTFQPKKEDQPEKSNIAQVRIVPRKGAYHLEVVYEKCPEKYDLDINKVAGIDLGVTNLATVAFNDNTIKPFYINGRPLQQINHYYHKHKAQLQTALPTGRYTSHKIQQLTLKRNNKIKDYLHKASKKIINYLIKNQIGTLVVGYNPLWKQNVNLGSLFNLKFTQIPFAEFLHQLKYKAELAGIVVKVQEESYTSKCSFLDGEKIAKQTAYKGKRIKRGLFKSAKGQLINADLNGAYNIIKKAIPSAFAKGIQGVVVHPYRDKIL